jgi:hypothetical protein
MHLQPPWVNKLLFPPTVKNKWKEPPKIDRLAALAKRQAGLDVCHCVEEFHLQQIRPLGR